MHVCVCVYVFVCVCDSPEFLYGQFSFKHFVQFFILADNFNRLLHKTVLFTAQIISLHIDVVSGPAW